jgi:hypothetical protein
MGFASTLKPSDSRRERTAWQAASSGSARKKSTLYSLNGAYPLERSCSMIFASQLSCFAPWI